MASGLNFSDPKSIRNWAIQLANACGGAEVRAAGPVLHKPSPVLANNLLEQFAQAYNEQLIQGDKTNAEEQE